MEKLSPLAFNDPREFLVAVYAQRKTRNRRYSVRAWAQKLGYRNPSLLSDVLKGRRRLTTEIRARLAQNLELSVKEQEYFELLCLMTDAKSARERHLYLKKSLELNPKLDTSSLDLDRFLLIKDWYHLTILEMVDLKDFQEDYARIARQLGDGLNASMVKSAIERLFRLGLLQRDEQGRCVRGRTHLCIGDNVPCEAIREHHEQFLDRAKTALVEQSLEERDFSGSTIAVRLEDIARVKELIDRFHEDLHRIAGRPQSDAVYRVNIQMFKVTKELSHVTQH